jgi:hypothetical protein
MELHKLRPLEDAYGKLGYICHLGGFQTYSI